MVENHTSLTDNRFYVQSKIATDSAQLMVCHGQPGDIRLVGDRWDFALRVVRHDLTCQIIKT